MVGDGRIFLTNSSRGGHWDPISIMLEPLREGGSLILDDNLRGSPVAADDAGGEEPPDAEGDAPADAEGGADDA